MPVLAYRWKIASPLQPIVEDLKEMEKEGQDGRGRKGGMEASILKKRMKGKVDMKGISRDGDGEMESGDGRKTVLKMIQSCCAVKTPGVTLKAT